MMNNIEKLLQEWRNAQPLKPDMQHRMDQQFMIDFNYNTNHIEGNTLTYGQTKLLLLFGRVEGEALMRDLEEMKASNVGLQMTKHEALDMDRPLSEQFIRELNNIILAGDFYKTSRDGEYRYLIHAGVYKTRPNSVITPSGETFDYASPEETPSLMADLVAWYRNEEQKKQLSVVELATLFHYRYIRIHPFEDGNGRIARLIVNYILCRHGYPMIVILTADRSNYLDVLGKCDKAVGTLPFDGANASIDQIKPFVDYIATYVERKLQFAKDLIEGKIPIVEETKIDVNEKMTDRQKEILFFIRNSSKVTYEKIMNELKISRGTLHKEINKMKKLGIISRNGADKDGHWEINIY
jgi:Fic family protein